MPKEVTLEAVLNKERREVVRPYVEQGWTLTTASGALRLSAPEAVRRLNPTLPPFVMVHQTANGARALANLKGDLRKFQLPEPAKKAAPRKTTAELEVENNPYFCTQCGIGSETFPNVFERDRHVAEKHPTEFTLAEAMALCGMKISPLYQVSTEIVATLALSEVRNSDGKAAAALLRLLPSKKVSSIAYHLAKLADAGVIKREINGKRTYCISLTIKVNLTDDEVKRFTKAVTDEVECEAPEAPGLMVKDSEPPETSPKKLSGAMGALGVLYPGMTMPASDEEWAVLNDWIVATNRLIETFGEPV